MRSFFTLALVIGAGMAYGCGGSTTAVRDENAETAKKVEQAVASAPTKGLLVDLETKAFDAWKKKDLAFWSTFLDDHYVSFTDGRRLDKAGEIKMLGEMKCEVASFAFSDEKMVPVGTDAIILTAKATVDGSCDGKKIPSPLTIGTLYVRSGDTWKAAYHNEVPITDPKSLKSGPKKAEINSESNDAVAARLLPIERRSWDALRSKNTSQIEASMTEDVTLVDQTGKVTIGKKAVVAAWTDAGCTFESAAPSGAVGSDISPVIAILTYKGNMAGKCETRPISDFWGTTIFQKDGGDWKAVYQFRAPA